MKFSIAIDILLPALQSVIGVVEKNKTLAVLANVLININEGRLILTGSDLEVEITTMIPIQDTSICTDFTVPAKKLFEICKTLDSGVLLNFELINNKLILKAKRTRVTLITLPAESFPNLDPMSSQSEFSISQRDLQFIIDATQFSMANNDVRYYLNGLLLEIFNNELRAVATDGHRLAFSFIDTIKDTKNIDEDQAIRLLVPRKAISEINRLLTDSEEPVKLSLSPSHLAISFKYLTLTTKLIDGNFPNYERVIPASELCTKNIVADKKVLNQSLTRIAVLSSEQFNSARLQFTNNNLIAIVHNPEQEEAEEHINIDYSGDEFTIGFNVSYLVEALNAIKEDQVILSLTENDSSCLIRGINNEHVKYVVMPMRL